MKGETRWGGLPIYYSLGGMGLLLSSEVWCFAFAWSTGGVRTALDPIYTGWAKSGVRCSIMVEVERRGGDVLRVYISELRS
jgi:hypothetical protein